MAQSSQPLISLSSGSSLTSQILNLLPTDHRFESHRFQGHWRFTWLLTSGPVRLVEIQGS